MDRKLLLRLGLLLLASVTSARSQQQQGWGSDTVTVQSSEVQIHAPDRLVGTLYHRGALFGNIPFGETIVRNVYYTKRPLCNGQTPGTPEYIQSDGYFLMVDRGDCSFVEKIRNAQRENATAVIIADNTCLCSVAGSCEAEEECEELEPTMDDDGSGIDIHIPSLLLLKPDADRLRDELVSGTMIEMSMSFSIPSAVNGRTEYMLFTTPDDLMSHQFLNSFLEAALAFGDKAYFKPRMLIKNGTEQGCRQYNESHVPCAGYCINYGRYCETRSYYDTESYDNKGTKLLVESIRRACIWDLYGKGDGVGRQWWAYVELWILHCSFSQYSTSCAEELYVRAGIDGDVLETCMNESGNFRQDVSNVLMETFLEDAAQNEVTFAPVLMVNGAAIHGALSFGNVVAAICSTFDESDQPGICSRWLACGRECSAGATCVLWGEDQECAEYRAPFLSNDDKQYDDDYISSDPTVGIDMLETSAPQVNDTTDSPADGIDGTLAATTAPSMEETNQAEDSTTSPDVTGSPTESFIEPTSAPQEAANEFETMEPTGNLREPNIPQSTPPLPDPTEAPQQTSSGVPTKEAGTSGQSGSQVVETIDIYEGSNNGLAIGLGVGIGAMFLFATMYLLIARDRRQMEDYHTMVSLSGMSHAGMSHAGMSHAGMSHSGMSHSGMSHSGMSHSGMSHGGMSHSGMSHGGMSRAGMAHKGVPIWGGSHHSQYADDSYPKYHGRRKLPRHVVAGDNFADDLTQEEEEDFYYETAQYPRRSRFSSRLPRPNMMRPPLSRFAQRIARKKRSQRSCGDFEEDGLMACEYNDDQDNSPTGSRKNKMNATNTSEEGAVHHHDGHSLSRRQLSMVDDDQSPEVVRIEDAASMGPGPGPRAAIEGQYSRRGSSAIVSGRRHAEGTDDDATIRVVNRENYDSGSDSDSTGGVQA